MICDRVCEACKFEDCINDELHFEDVKTQNAFDRLVYIENNIVPPKKTKKEMDFYQKMYQRAMYEIKRELKRKVKANETKI